MADNQDPLTALQQLLEDQKSQLGNATPTISDPNLNKTSEALVVPAAVEEAPPGPSAEEIAVLQQAKAEEDKIKIEEQLSKMQTELKDTPQYQARMSQKEASEADSEVKRYLADFIIVSINCRASIHE